MNGAWLRFFSGSPVRLQWLVLGALTAALTCAGLTIWALWERGERLGAERDVTFYRAQAAVLGDKLDACNRSVETVARLGETIRSDVRNTLADVRKAGQPLRNEVAAIAEMLRRPPPVRPDGQPADCNDAWREIEARRP